MRWLGRRVVVTRQQRVHCVPHSVAGTVTHHVVKQMLMEMQVLTSGAEIGTLKTPGRESLITYEQIVEIGGGLQELRGGASSCPCA